MVIEPASHHIYERDHRFLLRQFINVEHGRRMELIERTPDTWAVHDFREAMGWVWAWDQVLSSNLAEVPSASDLFARGLLEQILLRRSCREWARMQWRIAVQKQEIAWTVTEFLAPVLQEFYDRPWTPRSDYLLNEPQSRTNTRRTEGPPNSDTLEGFLEALWQSTALSGADLPAGWEYLKAAWDTRNLSEEIVLFPYIISGEDAVLMTLIGFTGVESVPIEGDERFLNGIQDGVKAGLGGDLSCRVYVEDYPGNVEPPRENHLYTGASIGLTALMLGTFLGQVVPWKEDLVPVASGTISGGVIGGVAGMGAKARLVAVTQQQRLCRLTFFYPAANSEDVSAATRGVADTELWVPIADVEQVAQEAHSIQLDAEEVASLIRAALIEEGTDPIPDEALEAWVLTASTLLSQTEQQRGVFLLPWHTSSDGFPPNPFTESDIETGFSTSTDAGIPGDDAAEVELSLDPGRHPYVDLPHVSSAMARFAARNGKLPLLVPCLPPEKDLDFVGICSDPDPVREGLARWLKANGKNLLSGQPDEQDDRVWRALAGALWERKIVTPVIWVEGSGDPMPNVARRAASVSGQSLLVLMHGTSWAGCQPTRSYRELFGDWPLSDDFVQRTTTVLAFHHWNLFHSFEDSESVLRAKVEALKDEDRSPASSWYYFIDAEKGKHYFVQRQLKQDGGVAWPPQVGRPWLLIVNATGAGKSAFVLNECVHQVAMGYGFAAGDQDTGIRGCVPLYLRAEQWPDENRLERFPDHEHLQEFIGVTLRLSESSSAWLTGLEHLSQLGTPLLFCLDGLNERDVFVKKTGAVQISFAELDHKPRSPNQR